MSLPVALFLLLPLLASAAPHSRPLLQSSLHSYSSPFLLQNYLSLSSRTLLSLPTTLRQDGLTGDICRTDSECVPERQCFTNGPRCSEEAEFCVCLPEETLDSCDTDSDCKTGEICAFFIPDEDDFCVSPFGLAFLNSFVPKVQPGESGTALHFESCASSDQCRDDLQCNTITGAPCDDFTEGCLCFVPDLSEALCASNEDCTVPGESCVSTNRGDLCISAIVGIQFGQPLSPSPSRSPVPSSAQPQDPPTASDGPDDPELQPDFSPVPSESVDALFPTHNSTATPLPSSLPPGGRGTNPFICIDATALSHLPSADLVYDTHSPATVLCDNNASCATPGHIVRFQGAPMRMSSYCRLVSCVQKVILVNSPRYKRGLLVKSNTAGLHFTALAARYDSRAEEIVLTTAMRLGL